MEQETVNTPQQPAQQPTVQPPYQYQQPYPPYATAPYVPKPYVKPENKFKPVMADFIFALVVFILGYVFARWVLFSWKGWGVAAFTVAYLLSVTAYLAKKDALVSSSATLFWMAVTLITGVSYALWENVGIAAFRGMFLFASAIYYVLVASGSTVMGKTSNSLILDGINAGLLIPFRNFFNQYVSFGILKGRKRAGKTVPVLIGVIIALILLACLIPMLLSADSGGFGIVVDFFAEIFAIDMDDVVEFILYCFPAVPVAAYIYGLISGAVFKKGTDTFSPESGKKTVAALRITPLMTILVILGAVCGLYLVFIFAQLPYFFSAFTGKRPDGWLVYAEYARQGFFELCGIAAINLALVLVANVTCKKTGEATGEHIGSPLLRTFNISLSIITMVLIATAFSKMAMYIDVYGLTMPRLMPCVFMVFLALVFGAVIVLQKRKFSVMRFALVTGSVILCVLFAGNPDALVVRYNSERYMSGTLREYDTEILWRSGHAGVPYAIEVYGKTSDQAVKENIARYLDNRQHPWYSAMLWVERDAHEYSYEFWRAIEALEGWE